MNEHPNATRLRQLFTSFQGGDLDAILTALPEAIADDAVWHFPGRSGRLAGAHRGRQAILDFLLQVQTLTAGTFHLELIDVVAGDEHAVVLFRGRGEREGRALDNPTCLHVRLRDGRAAELREFVWDLYAVDDFWK